MHIKTLHKSSTEIVIEPSKCECFTPQKSEEKYQPVFAWFRLTYEHIYTAYLTLGVLIIKPTRCTNTSNLFLE